jgi:hypothetical protein
MSDQLDLLLSTAVPTGPMIYAYSDISYPGCLKVGYTAVDVDKRVAQQYPTKRPDGSVPYSIVLRESAMLDDGSSFMDHDVHRALRKMGLKQLGDTEWFKCTVDDVKAAIIAIKTGKKNYERRTENFHMRPEQEAAVAKTIAYFNSTDQEGSGRYPKFLWNAKMRFGKTFASYELAKKMGFKRILVLTFKPVVASAWREDLETHIDFEGWQFISRDPDDLMNSLDMQFANADKSKPIVCFGSFQDFLGVDKNGGIKTHNEWVHEEPWDLVIFDEYHFGAWRDSAKKLFEDDEDAYEPVTDEKEIEKEARDQIDESWLPISASHYLYLSGTPFRALNSGEFLEEQIFTWTYTDEQRAKANFPGPEESNPYAELPQMVMMTYKIPSEIERIADNGQFNEFDLNVFFKAEGRGDDAHFIYEDYVSKWLQLIRGSYLPSSLDDLKLGARPPMPFSDFRLLNYLKHTLWYLPGVSACEAMGNMLRKDPFFADYKINVCAGPEAGIGLESLYPVQRSMEDPINSKTITLSCGKLMTGVTVRPWTGIFMLSNLSSPETYFQAAFRVQSPWTIKGDDGKKQIIKRQCFIFDFALNRALRQISDYSTGLDTKETNPEKKIAEFISFLPVLAYNGSTMERVDAQGILDLTTNGITATMLARRWESALLVNVDNDTLRRLMANKEAMDVLMKIEGFRSLNKDIETIINKSEHVKQVKKDGEPTDDKEKKQLTEEEKEYKSKRKEIQDKLIKFATRIPIFMYLTDYREETLKDVITQLEPALFKKVTGLEVKDFDLLVSLNVFNEKLMNDSVWKFRRYEDSSLNYTGINKHEGEKIGLFATVITKEDMDTMAGELADSEVAPKITEPLPDKPYFAGLSEENDGEEEDDTIITKKPEKPDAVGDVFAKPVPTESNFVEDGPKKDTIDPTTVKVGMTVKHINFGQGTVVEINGEIVKVQFPGEKRPRMFEFPKSFEKGFFTK